MAAARLWELLTYECRRGTTLSFQALAGMQTQPRWIAMQSIHSIGLWQPNHIQWHTSDALDLAPAGHAMPNLHRIHMHAL